MIRLLLFAATFSACASKTELEGRWQRICQGNGPTFGEETALVFDGSDFTLELDIFLGRNCETLLGEIRANGVFSVGAAGATSDGTRWHAVDFTDLKTTLTLTSSLATAVYNNSKTCSLDTWQTDEPVDVTGCADLGIPEQAYDIYHIAGESLRVGAKTGGFATDPSSRPTELDPLVFTRD